MPKTIHVPQGHSARLVRLPLSNGIEGLYTYGFTTCNIIAAIGKDKLALIHADLLTDKDAIKSEITWVGQPSDVVLIFRKKYKDILTQQMIESLKVFSPILREMDDRHDGVSISFVASYENSLHPNICKYPLVLNPKIPGLLRHPNEQKILAVRKIEQLIGIRARAKTHRARARQLNIFDGFGWMPFSESGLKVDISSPMTRKELAFIANARHYTELVSRLVVIIQEIQNSIPSAYYSIQDLALSIAPYLEGYLCDFSATELFMRNIAQLIDEKDKSSLFGMSLPPSKDDREICRDISEKLQRNNITVEDLQEIFSIYVESKTAPVTKFKQQLVSEFKSFYRHYTKRMIYQRLQQQYKKMEEDAASFTKEAQDFYDKGEFLIASESFLKTLRLCSCYCFKNSPNLVKAYTNLGRCYCRSAEYQLTYFCLNTALTLRKECLLPQNQCGKAAEELKIETLELVNLEKFCKKEQEDQIMRADAAIQYLKNSQTFAASNEILEIIRRYCIFKEQSLDFDTKFQVSLTTIGSSTSSANSTTAAEKRKYNGTTPSTRS